MRNIAEQIFLAGVEQVLPDRLLRSQLRFEQGRLRIGNRTLPPFRKLYVLAAGKAAASMGKAAEEILGDRITAGHVLTKYGHGLPLKRLAVSEAGHPLPDAAGVEATRRLLAIARQAQEGDLLLCLLSGGASALMTDLPEGCSLDELILANDLLVKSGADIAAINTLRKHVSAIKGGQLAVAAAPANVVSLILSDVVGDDPGVIASGPTAADPTTYADAWSVLERFGLLDRFPASLRTHLQKGREGLRNETPKPGDPIFNNVLNYMLGNNRLALEGAARKAASLGFETHILTDGLQGDVTDVEGYILQAIRSFAETGGRKPRCLLLGGEPTLNVSGTGLGGRNQHLALRLALKMDPGNGITLLCAGTDGTDGPTDAAGAVVDGQTCIDAQQMHIHAIDYLHRFDSYSFFQQVGGHIFTGSTRTNVMDMIVVLIPINSNM